MQFPLQNSIPLGTDVLGYRLQPTLNLSLRAPAYLLLASSSCDCRITLLLHSPPTLLSSSPSSPFTTSQLLSVYTMISFFTISVPAALIAAIAACLSYSFAKALYFLQLPNSPAPSWRLRVSGKCPRATSSTPRLTCTRYEFYCDIVLGGQYIFKIIRMHEEYGPIVRINPYELHVATPGFYQKLYTGPGKRRHRWNWYTEQFGQPESGAATCDHDQHRLRRAPLNPFFSKAAVRKHSPSLTNELTHC
jgi:hypothetical protein